MESRLRRARTAKFHRLYLRSSAVNTRSDKEFMTYKLDPRIQSGLTTLTLVILFVMLYPAIGGAQTKATFTPRITVSETYDDNLDLAPDNEESDWITVASPGFSLLLQSEKTDLNLDMEAGLSYYLQDSTRDTIRYRGRLFWDQQLSEYLSLRLSDTLTRSEDPVREDQGRIIDISNNRDVEYRNTGEASLSWQFGPQDTLLLGYRNHLLDSRSNDTEDSRSNEGFFDLNTWFVPKFGMELTGGIIRSEFQQPSGFAGIPTEDFYNYQAGLTMNYRWRPQHIAYARYSIVYQDFDEELIEDDYVVHQPTLGLKLDLGPNTDFGVEFGYFRQEFKDGGGEDGFVLNASFNTSGERASFGIQTNSGYELVYGTSQNRGFSKFSDNSARVDYELSENSDIFASARYRWDNFTEANQTDHTYEGRAGLNYAFTDWFVLALEGGHLRRDSNDEAEEFTDNRVTLRITTSYPIPLFGE